MLRLSFLLLCILSCHIAQLYAAADDKWILQKPAEPAFNGDLSAVVPAVETAPATGGSQAKEELLALEGERDGSGAHEQTSMRQTRALFAPYPYGGYGYGGYGGYYPYYGGYYSYPRFYGGYYPYYGFGYGYPRYYIYG